MANIIVRGTSINVDDTQIGKCIKNKNFYVFQMRLLNELSNEQINNIEEMIFSFLKSNSCKFNLNDFSKEKIEFNIFNDINGHSNFNIYYHDVENVEVIVVGGTKNHYSFIELFQKIQKITFNSYNIKFTTNKYEDITGFMVRTLGLVPLPTFSDDYLSLKLFSHLSLNDYKNSKDPHPKEIDEMYNILKLTRGEQPPLWLLQPFSQSPLPKGRGLHSG